MARVPRKNNCVLAPLRLLRAYGFFLGSRAAGRVWSRSVGAGSLYQAGVLILGVNTGDTFVLCDIIGGAGGEIRVTGTCSGVTGDLARAWTCRVGILSSRLVSGFPPCALCPFSFLSSCRVCPLCCLVVERRRPLPRYTRLRPETSSRGTSMDNPSGSSRVGTPETTGLAPPPPTPAEQAARRGLSLMQGAGAGPGAASGGASGSAQVKTEQGVTGNTGTTAGTSGGSPPSGGPGRDATGVSPALTSSPDVQALLAALREQVKTEVAEAIRGLSGTPTPGTLAKPPRGGAGPSGIQVATGVGGEPGGGPGGDSSDEYRRSRRSCRHRRSHRRRRSPSSSRTSSFSSSPAGVPNRVRRVLVAFQLPVHKVGDNLLNKVND